MLITDTTLQLQANHQSEERHQRRETLTVWNGDGERLQVSDESGRAGLQARAELFQQNQQKPADPRACGTLNPLYPSQSVAASTRSDGDQ